MATESCLVKAIYSFKGKNNDELCFKKGDIITVTQKEEGGWWEGTLGETTGWFPSNYVTEFKDPTGIVTTSPIRAPSEIQAFRNVVLKDIIDSEKAHVAEMQGLVTNFLQPLEISDMLTRDEFKQLTGNIREVLQTHEQFLSLLEECATKTGPEQRVGGLFLQWAPQIKSVHQVYCAGHPKAVCILDKYKENLNTWMENAGAVCPGVLVLTAGLSKPFRRLGKYPAMLQELARHVHEAHPDRGDTHRASVVYKDMASGCAALRRQKELELQVVTGEVRGWPGGGAGAAGGAAGELAALGDVLHMGGVAVGAAHADRYLVLFPAALLLLSVSKRVSAFVYEGCLPLTGITVCKLDDTDTRKNAFEISGPMIDTIVAVCQTKAEADNWVRLLRAHAAGPAPAPAHAAGPAQPHSLPQLARSPSEGALSSINTSRRSLYHVTLPPASYPSASPYYSLTKYFARLVKKKVITRQMLRKLLHERPWAKAFELTEMPVMRRHKNRIRLKIEKDGTVAETDCSDSEDSEHETETTESCTSSSLADADPATSPRILRQDAVETASPRSGSSAGSGWGGWGGGGYLRYYDHARDLPPHAAKGPVRGDCTRNIFQTIPSTSITDDDVQDSGIHLQLNLVEQNNLYPQYQKASTENSSFETSCPKMYMACENLANIDPNTQINRHANPDSDFLPTRRSFPSCAIKNDVPGKLWKSSEEHYPCDAQDEVYQTLNANVLEHLEPPPSPTDRARYNTEAIIIDPPPMFRSDEKNLHVINVNVANIPFRKHSLNSDKRIRRSTSKSMLEHEGFCKISDLEQRMSCQSDHSKSQAKCECCSGSACHSPRSSDSGVVGSCNLASPELSLPDHLPAGPAGPAGPAHTHHSDAQDKLYDAKKYSIKAYGMEYRKELTLSEIEAANYEDQCRCTSPFGSTARTSCETSVTSDNASLDVFDLSNTLVTPTFVAKLPLTTPEIKRTSIRRNIEKYEPTIKIKPEVPPRIYRKPSTHFEMPKNVRKQVAQWGTLDITERSKPSLHYHMRIYRERPEQGPPPSSPSPPSPPRGRERRRSRADDLNRKLRSRSEDLSKLQNGLTQSQTGFMVYRSDLYAHWWMKAKLPITVVTDSDDHERQ